jgi:hypothetical protein
MYLPVVVMMMATVHMWSVSACGGDDDGHSAYVVCILCSGAHFHAQHQTMHLSAAMFPEISSLPKGTDSCAVDDIRRM